MADEVEFDNSALRFTGLHWDDADIWFEGTASNPLGGVAAGNFRQSTGEDAPSAPSPTLYTDLVINDNDDLYVYEIGKVVADATVPVNPTQNELVVLGSGADMGNNWYTTGEYATIEPTKNVNGSGGAKGWAVKSNLGDVTADGFENFAVIGRSTDSGENWRQAVITLDLTSLGTNGEGYTAPHEYAAELRWVPWDQTGENGDWRPPRGVRAEKISPSSSYNASPEVLRTWPAWDANGDGLNDVLISAPTYPWPIPPIIDSASPMTWDEDLDGYFEQGESIGGGMTSAGHVGHLGDQDESEHLCLVDSDTGDGNYGGEFGCSAFMTEIAIWTNYTGGDNTYHSRDADHDPFADVGKMYLLTTPPFVTTVNVACQASDPFEQTITVTGGGLRTENHDTAMDVDDIQIFQAVLDMNLNPATVDDVRSFDNMTRLEIDVTLESGMVSDLRPIDIVLQDRTIRVYVALDTGLSCGGPIMADLDADGRITKGDLAILLASYGRSGESLRGDLDNDGCVGQSDVQQILRLID